MRNFRLDASSLRKQQKVCCQCWDFSLWDHRFFLRAVVMTEGALHAHRHVAGIVRVHVKALATMLVILRVQMIATPHVQDRLPVPLLALIVCILVRAIARVLVLVRLQARHLAQGQVALQPALVVALAAVVAVAQVVVQVAVALNVQLAVGVLAVVAVPQVVVRCVEEDVIILAVERVANPVLGIVDISTIRAVARVHAMAVVH